jgi:hypothetical protein
MVNAMRRVKLFNGNFFVAYRKIEGIARYAYFTPEGNFISYASESEWNRIRIASPGSVEKVKDKTFTFPPLSQWMEHRSVVTREGTLSFFWRWKFEKIHRIPQTSMVLNDEVILEKSNSLIVLSEQMIKRINLLHDWIKSGFSRFTHKDILSHGLPDCGSWYIPTILMKSCLESGCGEVHVKRATDFIGIQQPFVYNVYTRDEKDKWVVEFSYRKEKEEGRFLIEMHNEGKIERFECVSTGDEPENYRRVLWILLHPVKEKIEELRGIKKTIPCKP